jgi:hypothetical protein
MKQVGRFLIRGGYAKKTDGTDSASPIIGFAFSGFEEHFKPNHLYEIVDILGELVIRDLGKPAGITAKYTQENYPGFMGKDFNQLFEVHSPEWAMTSEEYNKLL